MEAGYRFRGHSGQNVSGSGLIRSAASIFEEYYARQEFVDRYVRDPANAVDVVIPVYHTNELWRANLISIYRDVPVRRLLISDGGCIDDSINIAKEFPRVEIFDHRQFKSLGKCIAELIKEVTSEWFIYLHSDVYLPVDWFDNMVKHQWQYDWFGCPMNITVMVNYRLQEPNRPYAGSQMGRRAAFFPAVEQIDDDFIYRQEDFVFKRIVERNGFKEGKVEDTFHYHQVMFRPSRGYDLQVEAVDLKLKVNEAEKKRANLMQVYGLIKYLEPSSQWLVELFTFNAFLALDSRYATYEEIEDFIKRYNPIWGRYFNRGLVRRRKLRVSIGKWKQWVLDRSRGSVC